MYYNSKLLRILENNVFRPRLPHLFSKSSASPHCLPSPSSRHAVMSVAESCNEKRDVVCSTGKCLFWCSDCLGVVVNLLFLLRVLTAHNPAAGTPGLVDLWLQHVPSSYIHGEASKMLADLDPLQCLYALQGTLSFIMCLFQDPSSPVLWIFGTAGIT